MTAPPVHAIDVVVAWVDGSDPAHQAKLNAYLAELGHRPKTALPTRFNSVGEIDFCILSLLRFAPFVRRIHVVTDAQLPPILARLWQHDASLRERVVCVDHRAIFAGHEDCLPTFNSRSIETMMWRIPGLAEHFVYFNDDMLLIKGLAPEDWFRAGWPVLHGRYKTLVDREWAQRAKRALRRLLNRPKPPSPLFQRAQSIAAARLGFDNEYFAVEHCPHPLRRSTFERHFAAHPQDLRNNIEHRLRSATQFQPYALANHLEIRAHQVHLEANDRALYAEPASMTRAQLAQALAAAERDPRVAFACVQSLDEADEAVRKDVFDWFARVIGSPPTLAA
jgi:Stealth protein CR2, conserved region 2/Stealth protein CR1, conserved region 1